MLQILLSSIDNIDQYIALIAAIIVIAEIIANLTPSTKDNSIILKIKKAFDFLIPNKAKTDEENTSGKFEIGSRIIKKLKNRKK